jgi:hypothetical protein
MKRRRNPRGDSVPLTLGVAGVATLLALLFLRTAYLVLCNQAFYIGWCGPRWEFYNGDGMIRPDSEPVFFVAMVAVFALEGLACTVIALLGFRELLARLKPAS